MSCKNCTCDKMKFTEEDGVITAAEALKRTENGCEDSLVREPLRALMNKIKTMSGYGYDEIYEIHQSEPMSNELVVELEKLGYKVTCYETYDFLGKKYKWKIQW